MIFFIFLSLGNSREFKNYLGKFQKMFSNSKKTDFVKFHDENSEAIKMAKIEKEIENKLKKRIRIRRTKS